MNKNETKLTKELIECPCKANCGRCIQIRAELKSIKQGKLQQFEKDKKDILDMLHKIQSNALINGNMMTITIDEFEELKALTKQEEKQ